MFCAVSEVSTSPLAFFTTSLVMLPSALSTIWYFSALGSLLSLKLKLSSFLKNPGSEPSALV